MEEIVCNFTKGELCAIYDDAKYCIDESVYYLDTDKSIRESILAKIFPYIEEEYEYEAYFDSKYIQGWFPVDFNRITNLEEGLRGGIIRRIQP